MGAAVLGPGASAAGALNVPAERRQRALATVFGGMTAAAVLVVPLASFLGGSLGWRPRHCSAWPRSSAIALRDGVRVRPRDPGRRIRSTPGTAYFAARWAPPRPWPPSRRPSSSWPPSSPSTASRAPTSRTASTPPPG
ncbi:hypothetical protein ACRAWF_12300 [Streptomyces sp. L7]